jgi:CBS domain-containing protein
MSRRWPRPPEPPAVAEVTVTDVMHRGVIFCERRATAHELADTMIARGVHGVAVVDHAQNDRHAATVWGIVSDVDLLAAALDPEAPATAGDLADQPVIVIRADRPIGEAAATMATFCANRLVVIDPGTCMTTSSSVSRAIRVTTTLRCSPGR